MLNCTALLGFQVHLSVPAKQFEFFVFWTALQASSLLVAACQPSASLQVCWRRCCLTVPDQDWEDISCRIEEHVASFSRRSASLPNLSIESGLTSPPKADKDQQDAKAVIQPDVLS